MLKRIVLFVVVLLVIIFLAVIQAQPNDIEVKSSVDKNAVALDEVFTFTLEVSGTLQGAPEIKLPDFKKDFFVLSSGQSERMLLKGRERSVTLVYEFLLQPKQEGTITIGEAQVIFKKDTYMTQPLDIKVGPAKEKSPQPQTPEEVPDEGLKPPSGGYLI